MLLLPRVADGIGRQPQFALDPILFGLVVDNAGLRGVFSHLGHDRQAGLGLTGVAASLRQ
jgi:hypothetical protein